MADASSIHNIASLVVRTARRFPRLPAVASGNAVVSDYATLATRVSALASSLGRRLEPGDRVAIVAKNCPEYVEALFGCWHAGLCAVPVNNKLHPAELDYVLHDSGARWALVDEAWSAAIGGEGMTARLDAVIAFDTPAYAALVRDAGGAGAAGALDQPSAVAPHAPAWIFYTSGTTGRPKGVVLTHANLLAAALCFQADVEPVTPGDALLHAAPMSHGSGLYIVPHVLNAAVNVIPESRGFDAAEICTLLDRWSRVAMFAAPTMVKRLIAHPGTASALLDHLKCVVYGGGPMYVEDCKAAYAALGPRLAQIYGQGESPMTITALSRPLLDDAMARNDVARIGSVGVAQTGIEVRIGGDRDVALSPGEIGEVLVRGPTVMQGYWNNPDATASTLANGWLHTGDLGVLDADGFLTLKDRSKDLIISGGSNIYPREVEEALLRHASVAEVSVVGRAHPEWGEEVVACVVARPDAPSKEQLESELDQLCLAQIARFKRPRAYVFLDELPKNNAGKVLKTELRATLARH
jgi:acyl-CoA synthetase (AMP-forming)/AMP-acid ligase II